MDRQGRTDSLKAKLATKSSGLSRLSEMSWSQSGFQRSFNPSASWTGAAIASGGSLSPLDATRLGHKVVLLGGGVTGLAIHALFEPSEDLENLLGACGGLQKRDGAGAVEGEVGLHEPPEGAGPIAEHTFRSDEDAAEAATALPAFQSHEASECSLKVI